jgi:Tfp pilus assembly protein PilF
MAMANDLELANHYRKKQDYDRALRIVNRYMELCSNDPDAFNVMGMIYRDLGNMGGIATSEHWLRKAVTANPSPRHLVNLGMTLLQQAKWRDGWRFFSARKDVF